MTGGSSPNTYLQPGRLADVLTLIQVLAYDESTRRSAEGLRRQLHRNPLTSETWISLSKEHPEFFRVFDPAGDPEKREFVALVSRFVLPSVIISPGKDAKTPPLTSEITNNLMNIALELHDRQVQHRDRWKTVVIPTVAAIIAAVASVTAAVIVATKPMTAVPASVPTAAQPVSAADAPPAARR